MNKLVLSAVVMALVAISTIECMGQQPTREIEDAVLAAQAAPERQQEESYQRVYDAFTRLMNNVSNNSLGNFRRLVSRLNNLVGAPAQQQLPVSETKEKPLNELCERGIEEKTEQILNRLDRVNKNTDQNTLSTLNDDVNKLVTTLNNSYLRNIRRVVERVNNVVGQPTVAASQPGDKQFLQGDRLDDQHNRQPGFPGWDEFMVAMDRMQKSLAHFVRSSTRLLTSG